MANTISPFGAQDYVHQGGSQRTEELATVWIASSDPTPIFNGDLVSTYNPTAALVTGGQGSYITQGTSAAGPWKGVFRGCEYFNSVSQRMVVSRYWPGAGAVGTSSMTGDIKAQIISDPSYRFICQGSSQAVFGSSNVGQACSVNVNGVANGPSSAGGNPFTQNSGMQIGSSGTTAVTAAVSAFPFRLVDLYSNVAPGNPLSGFPGAGGAQAAFVNGTDNTTPGQILVVEPLNWESRAF